MIINISFPANQDCGLLGAHGILLKRLQKVIKKRKSIVIRLLFAA